MNPLLTATDDTRPTAAPVLDDAAGAAPLVARLVTERGAQWVRSDTLNAWMRGPGARVLFFHGDPVRFPEALDLAVVLPELQKAAGEPLALGVTTRADEDALATRCGVQRWPSLVFLRDGGHLGTLSGMKDWTDFVDTLRSTLQQRPGRLPSIGIPLVAA